MCGIFGYTGNQNPIEIVMENLKHLEYRGYDSTGIAIFSENSMEIYKIVGKVQELSKIVPSRKKCWGALGHTRWATHGSVSRENAHPHADFSGRIAIVHNGVVENASLLRKIINEQNIELRSQTDTELIVHILGLEYEKTGSLTKAFAIVLPMLEGSNAFVCCCVDEPEVLVAARTGMTGGLAIGLDDLSGGIVTSDRPLLASLAPKNIVLESSEIAVVRKDEFEIISPDGTLIDRKPTVNESDFPKYSKGIYSHYMLKEIMEQPESLNRCLDERIDIDNLCINIEEVDLTHYEAEALERVIILGCGTSFYASLVIKQFIQEVVDIPTWALRGSEFRGDIGFVDNKTLFVVVSQSGETADSLSALTIASQRGAKCVAIVNVEGSQIHRLANSGAITIRCGPEIAVACTKSFTGQITCGYLLGLKLAIERCALIPAELHFFFRELIEVPNKVSLILEGIDFYSELSKSFISEPYFLYLGRSISYPIALEGALKMLELSYIPSLAYPAGEIKHGPIALVEKGTPVFCIAPSDCLIKKMLLSIEEVSARQAKTIVVSDLLEFRNMEIVTDFIEIPYASKFASALISVVPLQLFAYFVSYHKGLAIDQPRNLAKSVTVE